MEKIAHEEPLGRADHVAWTEEMRISCTSSVEKRDEAIWFT